jgi:glycosyltransferase involved in cell wall biosynthesis
MKQKLTVSTLIDTYNYGHYIEEAIESVLKQTYPSNLIEIIIVDDASTDNTKEVTQRYQDKIKYFYKQNGGQSSAFNLAFEKASGEIIALLDADDTWLPTKLEKVCETFEMAKDADVVYHYTNFVNEKGDLTDRFPCFPEEGIMQFNERPLNSYLQGKVPFAVPTPGISARRMMLNKIFPLPEEVRIHTDAYLWFILPLYARGFALVPEYLANIRSHRSSHWRARKTVDQIEEKAKIYAVFLDHLEQDLHGMNANTSLLKNKIHSLIEWSNIVSRYMRGEKLNAIRQAMAYEEVIPSQNRFRKFLIKSARVLSLVFSYSLPLYLRELYKRSILNCWICKLKILLK